MHKTFFHSFSAGLAILTLALASSAQQVTQQARIGNYSIAPYGTLRVTIRKDGGYDATIVGQAGRTLLAKSPEYDISAPRMEIGTASVRIPVKSSSGGKEKIVKKQKTTRFITTGATKIVKYTLIRSDTGASEDDKRKTVITCGAMRYSATTAPTDRGIMRLSGGVRSETTDPTLVEPLVLTGDTGTATFQDDGTILVTMDATGNNGSATGRVRESPPKGKKP